MTYRRPLAVSREGSWSALPWMVAVAFVSLAGAAIAPQVDGDAVADLVGRVGTVFRWISHAVSGLTAPALLALLLVCLSHYVAAAAAARAAVGVRLRFAELIAAQLTAAAANRFTPAGLGGAGVLVRYFCRRGLTKTQATAALSTMAVLGGLADLLAFTALLGLGALFGVGGAASEIPQLLSRVSSVLSMPPAWIRLAIAIAIIASAALILTPQLRSSNRLRVTAVGLLGYLQAVAALCSQPKRVAVMMTASAVTTLSMATGFATAAVLGPAALPPSQAGALMIGYMLGSAAANAVPSPGGVGTTDAALVGVLIASGVHPSAAITTVLAFRVVTFWLPAVAGAVTARWLRAQHAL